MIISHRHSFIFFAIPKTGTHAVRRALRTHLAADDEEQVGLFERRTLPYAELAQLRHGHLSARQLRPVLGEKKFARYFKFAFVRNPFDRFVSYCAFMTRESEDFQRDPGGVMRYIITELNPVEQPLYKPQHEFLVDDAGALQTDFLGRHETMQESYDAICARIGIASAPLERLNATAHRDYREYYDDELIALVGARYADDLRLFGYRFDGPVR